MSTISIAVDILRGRISLRDQTARRYSLPTPTLTWTSDGLSVSADEMDWSASATVYRAVALISQSLAALRLTVDTSEGLDDMDPVAVLYNQGGPKQTISARVVREVAFAQAELKGQAFIYLDRGGDPTAPVQAMYPIYADVAPVIGIPQPDGGYIQADQASHLSQMSAGVIGYQVRTPAGQTYGLLPADVLWLRYPHPTLPWQPLAPWKSAIYPAVSDAYARTWQRAEYQNNARPSGIIGLGNVTTSVYERAVADIRHRVSGPDNASQIMVVASDGEGGQPTFERFSLTPEEMSYIESRKANADEMLLAFGIGADIFRPGSTFENRREAKVSMWSETFVPKLDVFASEIDRQMLPDPARTVAYDLSEVDALRDTQDAVIERATSLAEADIATVDEARDMAGLEPLPGGAGAMTITPYRERAKNAAAAEYMTSTSGGTRSIRLPGRTVLRRPREHRTRRIERRDLTEAEIDAIYTTHEDIGQVAVTTLAQRQEKAVIRELKKQQRSHVRMSVSDIFDIEFWTKQTEKLLGPFLRGVWDSGGTRLVSTVLGLPYSGSTTRDRVLAAMRDRLVVLSGQITATTAEAIERVVMAGATDGLSIPDMVEQIQGIYSDMETWRAEAIARTETVGGYNAASHVAADAIGTILYKEWLATGDHRTRESHAALSGTRIKMSDRYANGCLYPGDASAPPDETVNCRCVELYYETER